MTDDPTARPADPQKRADALRADIERTRTQLGETVAELAYKADIKARVADRAAALRQRPAGLLTAALGAVLAVLAYLWWRHH
jgi:hypothetical protein